MRLVVGTKLCAVQEQGDYQITVHSTVSATTHLPQLEVAQSRQLHVQSIGRLDVTDDHILCVVQAVMVREERWVFLHLRVRNDERHATHTMNR